MADVGKIVDSGRDIYISGFLIGQIGRAEMVDCLFGIDAEI